MDNNDLEFFFNDMQSEEQNQNLLPPEDVRFINIKTEQVMDDSFKRFRIYLETTPFQEKPHIELILIDQEGREITTASIIEPIQPKNVITMHLKQGQTGNFTLNARLYYPEVCDSDQKNIELTII